MKVSHKSIIIKKKEEILFAQTGISSFVLKCANCGYCYQLSAEDGCGCITEYEPSEIKFQM
jgi:hypothetical protein